MFNSTGSSSIICAETLPASRVFVRASLRREMALAIAASSEVKS